MAQNLDQNIARELLPLRDDRQAKWHFGRTALVCGSAGMSGAALLSTQAALRSGAGLVQLCSVAEVIAAALCHAAVGGFQNIPPLAVGDDGARTLEHQHTVVLCSKGHGGAVGVAFHLFPGQPRKAAELPDVGCENTAIRYII